MKLIAIAIALVGLGYIACFAVDRIVSKAEVGRQSPVLVVENCRENDEPLSCYAFWALVRFNEEERRAFTKKHDCGHDPDRFALDCVEEAQGCDPGHTDDECHWRIRQRVERGWRVLEGAMGGHP